MPKGVYHRTNVHAPRRESISICTKKFRKPSKKYEAWQKANEEELARYLTPPDEK